MDNIPLTTAVIFLLLLHTRVLDPLRRVEVQKDGLWWVNWDGFGGKHSTRILRWSPVKKGRSFSYTLR